MQTNISLAPEETISRMLTIIGQPVRIRILMVIQHQPACVCHLEAVLGLRQASISQHLINLRKAGLVSAQRDGRNIFYHLTNPQVVALLRQAAQIAGIPAEAFERLAIRPAAGCTCPQCNPGIDPKSTCQNARTNKST